MTRPEVSSIGQSATRAAPAELACTTAVGFVVAVAVPAELVAVTATRRVCPASALVRTYVEPVPTGLQAAPFASQLCHW